MARSLFLLILLLCALGHSLSAQVIDADPSTYKALLSTLEPGDTLQLAPGTYTERLKLVDVIGTPAAPIVIRGTGESTFFIGNACCNTVSLTRCAYLVLQDFRIDGENIPYIDAVKAEGTTDNWAHHITLENLQIVGHGANQSTVGISTKCPAWDWIIRGCIIEEAGTGMYLGNSNGEEPFVNGIIEHNLILNTIGYNLQIKHQNVGSRNAPGMTLDGRTIIRHNVFTKAANASTGGSARPNLLVGNFPATGDGANDHYAIYGNFFWQNPVENLFQGTGNMALYDNIGVNTAGGHGFAVQLHNGFKPRIVHAFHNTLLTGSGWGIRLLDTDPNYPKTLTGNAIFCDHNTPIRLLGSGSNIVEQSGNVTVPVNQAFDFVQDPTTSLGTLDLYPLQGSGLLGDVLNLSSYNAYTDHHRDFNGTLRDGTWRGAYAGSGSNPGWMLELARKPPVDTLSTSLDDPLRNELVQVFPNPVQDQVWISCSADIGPLDLTLLSPQGQVIRQWTGLEDQTISWSVKDLPAGHYPLWIRSRTGTNVRFLVITPP